MVGVYFHFYVYWLYVMGARFWGESCWSAQREQTTWNPKSIKIGGMSWDLQPEPQCLQASVNVDEP